VTGTPFNNLEGDKREVGACHEGHFF